MPRGEHLKRIPREVRMRNLGVSPLKPGETSRLVQVRGPAEVIQVFRNLPAEERGRVVVLGLAATEAGVRDPEELKESLEQLGEFWEFWGRLPRPVRWILLKLWG